MSRIEARVVGTCCEPILPHNSIIHLEEKPLERLTNGNLVSIKTITEAGEPVSYLGQLFKNPQGKDILVCPLNEKAKHGPIHIFPDKILGSFLVYPD